MSDTRDLQTNASVEATDAGSAPGEKIISVEVKGKVPAKRAFSVVRVLQADKEVPDIPSGCWKAKTPAGAARKAANEACKTLSAGSDKPCTVAIDIKEVTKNSSAKEYSYLATRSLSEKDVKFAGGSGEVRIPFKYSMTLQSLRKNGAGQVVAKEEVPTTDEATVEGQAS